MNIEELANTPDNNNHEKENAKKSKITEKDSVISSIENDEHDDEDDGRLKILAVDDTAFFLRQLQSYFNDTPYALVCVNSGKQALRYLNENRMPDLFLLDIDMPEMNGYELAKHIQDRGLDKPIIFLTSHKNRAAVMKAIEAGGVDFIVKPCRKEDVVARVNKHLFPDAEQGGEA